MGFVKRFRDFISSYFKSTFGSEWISYEEFWQGVLKDKKLLHPGDRIYLV